MHTIDKTRKSMQPLTHKLVDGNHTSSCNVPSNLLGLYVSVLKVDDRLGLSTVQGYDYDTGAVFTDQFDTNCVEVIR